MSKAPRLRATRPARCGAARASFGPTACEVSGEPERARISPAPNVR